MLRLYAFKSEDGTLAGEAKATARSVVPAGRVELKVGEAADPIDCEVVRGRIDPATRAFRAVEDLKKANLTTMEPALVEVSVASEAPLLIFDVPYTKGVAQGEFKLAMLSSTGVSFACSQDTAGFRGTFRTAVLSLANSLRDPTREVRPRTRRQRVELTPDPPLRLKDILWHEPQEPSIMVSRVNPHFIFNQMARRATGARLTLPTQLSTACPRTR